MFCPECGKEIPDDSVFCSECGARIDGPEENSAVQRNAGQSTVKQVSGNDENISGKKTVNIPVIAGIAAVALVAIVIIVVLMKGGSDKGTPAAGVNEADQQAVQETAAESKAEAAQKTETKAETDSKVDEKKADVTEEAEKSSSDETAEPHWVTGTGNPSKVVSLYDCLNDGEKSIYDALEDHYKTGTKEYRLKNQDGPSMDMFERAEFAFMNDHPYIGTAHYYTAINRIPVTAGSTEYRMMFEDNRDYSADYEAMKAQIDPLVKELKGTASEKVLQINDYLVDRVYYDTAYKDNYLDEIGNDGWRAVDPANMPNEITHSAYAALVEQVAVCDGYALAFAAICKEAGIPCYVIRGDALGDSGASVTHAWNIVQLEDGNWYEVDTTWNDSRGNHTYFCIPSSEMEQNHIRKNSDMYGFADVIPRTDEVNSGNASVSRSGAERPAFADFYWVDDLQDKEKTPVNGSEQLSDADSISGDWKVMLMIVPSEDNIYDWRMLLNMNISISGSDATVKADWYRNYTLVPGTLQQFSVYDAENDEDIVYTGTFDSNPKEKTLVVQDKEHSPEKKYEFNGGGNIDTIKIERFFEKDGVQYGVGVVYGNDGEAIARITMVR